MLAKAELLRTLEEQNVNHADAFETAMRDKNRISGILDGPKVQFVLTLSRTVERTWWKRNPNVMRGCGNYRYGGTETGDRPSMCTAWGQTCKAFGKQNYFKKVCRSKGENKRGAIWSFEDEEATIESLITHVLFNPITSTYKPGNNNGHEELEKTLIAFSLCQRHPHRLSSASAPGPVLDFGPERGPGKGTMADLGPLIRHLVSTRLPSGGRAAFLSPLSPLYGTRPCV